MSRKENRPQFWVVSGGRRAQFTGLDIIDTEEELTLHPLTLAECLVGPARVGREAEALRVIENLGIASVRLTDEQPLALARLRADTSLRMPECCVLAAALETGASLATFDATLARVASERGIVVVAQPPLPPGATNSISGPPQRWTTTSTRWNSLTSV